MKSKHIVAWYYEDGTGGELLFDSLKDAQKYYDTLEGMPGIVRRLLRPEKKHKEKG